MDFALLLLSGLSSPSQLPGYEKILATVKEQAQVYGALLISDEYEKLADRTHPALIDFEGGRERFIDLQRRRAKQVQAMKLRVTRLEVQSPKEMHIAGRALVVFLRTQTCMDSFDGRWVDHDHLIGSSWDLGKTWYFMERAFYHEDDVRDLYPGMASSLDVPPRSVLLEDESGPRVFTSVQANFRLAYPKGWKRVFSPRPDFLLTLERSGQLIYVSGEESDMSAEDLFQFHVGLASKSTKEVIQREEPKIDGVTAMLARADLDRGLESTHFWVTTFEHQGITYRIFGLGPKGKSPDLETGFRSVLKSFTFLGERKEWLAKNLGKPARTAFLAGLASFELNRPRWQEVSFDEPTERTSLESLRFKKQSGSGWINIDAYDQRTSVKEELEVIQQNFAHRLEKFESKRILVKGPKGFIAGVEMTGNHGATSFVVLGAAFVKGGIAVHVTLECQASQRSQMQKDWEQLVRDFRLDDPASQKPLFPLRQRDLDRQPPHPVLTLILKKATMLFPSNRLYDVHSISADGQQALMFDRDDCFLENLSDRKRTRLATIRPQFGTAATWSRDGKQIAFATFKTVGFHTIGTRTSFETPIRAGSLAFLPDDRLLIATLPQTPDEERFRPGGQRFIQQRLVRYEEGEEPKTLLEFPLARFAHLAVSPDGKRLALVSNKDHPRTSARAGHLYVAQPDGTGLRQLTKDPEIISSVAWSADGRFLYVVRRLMQDRESTGARYSLNRFSQYVPGDLFRISVETGEAINLTRCGKIDQAWVQGDHLLLRISSFDVALSQNGIFKIAASDLGKIASSLPEPKLSAAKTQARQIAERLRAAFAPRRLQEVVPTTEGLDKLARVFAEVATETFGEPFNFSAASLDSLPRWADWLETALAFEPSLIYGFGAYYGETLRRIAKAEWRLGSLPLGEWLPARASSENPVAQVVLPFSELYRFTMRSEMDFIRTSDMLRSSGSVPMVLVYPPSHAEAALKSATSKGYLDARQALDRGEIESGLQLLVKEVKRQPKNALLASEALQLCETARMPALADQMAKEAVDAGSEVHEFLLRYADLLAKSEPQKALTLYRKAAQAPFVTPETYLKLGKQLAALHQQPLADCCFRRAYMSASDAQRDEIRRLLEMPKQERFGGIR